MSRVVLALGSNLGDRFAHLCGGLVVVSRSATVLAVSPVYETAPVGGPAQPDYLNAVVVVQTDEDPLALAEAAEQSRDRRRSERWGPRTLDVDVIDVDGRSDGDPRLTLPHPRAAQRPFVLLPWLDADPLAVLPGHGPVAGLAAGLRADGVVRRDDIELQAGA